MRRYFIILTINLLIFLWTYTALSKLLNLPSTVTFLSRSPFKHIAAELAVAIPALELFLALALLVHATQHIALKASLLLLTIFTIYIFYMLQFFPNKPCNCGGVINTMSWTQHIFFNLFFIITTALAIKWYHHKEVDQPGHAEHPLN